MAPQRTLVSLSEIQSLNLLKVTSSILMQNISKLKKLLEYNPEVKIYGGLTRVVQWNASFLWVLSAVVNIYNV